MAAAATTTAVRAKAVDCDVYVAHLVCNIAGELKRKSIDQIDAILTGRIETLAAQRQESLSDAQILEVKRSSVRILKGACEALIVVGKCADSILKSLQVH